MALAGLLANRTISATGADQTVSAQSGGGISGLFARAIAKGLTSSAVGQRAGNNLRADVLRLGTERDEMQPARARNIGAIGNAASRLRNRLSNEATMRVAQADSMPQTSFRGALESATRRMRARQGIVNRGDAAIRTQALRDRIEVARGSASRRGSIQNALQTAANIREGVNVGVSNANQRIAQSRANMFGTLAGAATSYMIGRAGQNKGFGGLGEGVTEQSVNLGTAAADAANMNYYNPQPVVYG